MCVCVCVCVCMCGCVWVCMWVCVGVCVGVGVGVCGCLMWVSVSVSVCVGVCVWVCGCGCVYVYVCVCVWFLIFIRLGSPLVCYAKCINIIVILATKIINYFKFITSTNINTSIANNLIHFMHISYLLYNFLKSVLNTVISSTIS